MKKKIGNIMKFILPALILIIAANFFLANSSFDDIDNIFHPDSVKVIKPKTTYQLENQLISTILSRYHYKDYELNDSLSSVILNNFIDALDHSKSYFLAADINEFLKYDDKLDDLLLDGRIDPFYQIFNTYLERMQERLTYVDTILSNEFDYTIDEVYYYNRDDKNWAKTTEELNEFWRKRLKNDALSYKLNGKDWEDTKETLTKRYRNYAKFLAQYNSEDVFQLAMNSYTQAIDPHTNYFSPITSDNFKIDMSLSFEGIGARLQTEDDYTKIVEIIAGGPADKSNLLKVDDKIIGVAQEDDEEFEDVIGWRINDVVKLIRGEKGTKVRLKIIPATADLADKSVEIVLVRDKVKLEDQSAKSDLIEVESKNKEFKIGIIKIPKFYSDFEAQQRGEKDFKSTTRDVKYILDSLKQTDVDGIVIDLRNDGGGSLSEAIDLTGLFIKDGPVVQVRNLDGSIEIGEDVDPELVYDGPLAVLVNRFSASASEIFAGAIQDYGRGVILGEQTFGKGTVQNLIDLNRLASSSENTFGQVKLTVAKYYRIDGSSTQHLGVVPDINFPTLIDPEKYGESSEPSALPWDQIEPTDYQEYSDLKDFIPLLKEKHLKRMQNEPDYEFLNEDIEEYKLNKEKKFVSLKESVRKEEKQEKEQTEFERENERRKKKGLKLLDKEEIAEESSEETDEDDFLLIESAKILADYINLTIG